MNAEWQRTTRRYQKAMGAVDHAIEHLMAAAREDDDYPTLAAINTAVELLRAAADRLNAEYTADRKRLGIGIYRPYGRP